MGFYNFSRLIPFMAMGKGDPLNSLMDTAKAYAENANIPISVALALGVNKDVRTGRIIDPLASSSIKSSEVGYTVASDVTKNLMLMLPEDTRKKFGWMVTTNPYTKATEYKIDPWLNYFITKNPVIVANTIIPLIPLDDVEVSKDRGWVDTVADTLTGFRTRGILDYEILGRIGERALNDRLGKLLQQAGLMNVIETPNMTPAQVYTNELPQSIDQRQKAIEYLNSPLGLKAFNEMKETLKAGKLKKVTNPTIIE